MARSLGARTTRYPAPVSKRVRNCFVLSNSVVEHLGDDPVATALGSDFVSPRSTLS